jgi:hypothetical protein
MSADQVEWEHCAGCSAFGPVPTMFTRWRDRKPDLEPVCNACLAVELEPVHDPVEHPKHYTQHPSGVECIDITEHMGFCLGNAIKYIWRANLKGGLEDLRKAQWYIQREISRLEYEEVRKG